MAVNGHKRTYSVINGRKRTETDIVPPDCCTFALGMRTRAGLREVSELPFSTRLFRFACQTMLPLTRTEKIAFSLRYRRKVLFLQM